MFGLVTLVFSLAVATEPSLLVHWSSREHVAVSVRGQDLEQDVLECLESGRQARVRIEMQLCRRRTGWFDSCSEPRPWSQSVEFDPITESYRLLSDKWRDEEESVVVGIPARAEAIRTVTAVEEVPLTVLANSDQRLLSSPTRYLNVRTLFSCRGDVNRTLGRISPVLTFGLLNVVESDSGWKQFDMQAEVGEPEQ